MRRAATGRAVAMAENAVPRRLLSTKSLEVATLLLVSGLATLRSERKILFDPLTFQTDSQIHEFWMRRFRDPALFDDPLTDALVGTGYGPPLWQFLFRLASPLIDPVAFGELLPLVLQPLACWLVFRIIREHVAWRPAAWFGAVLFLVAWDAHRFSGGHSRAFVQPIVLLAVLLLLRRRNFAAALVPPIGLLLYPPAGLLALAVVILATVDRRAPLLVDQRRAAAAAVGIATSGAVVLAMRLLAGSNELVSRAEARQYPEFGENGPMHFFVPSTLEYLQQNYSGFFLGRSGAILAVAAVVLIVVRPKNAALLRWEMWCVPVASLALFAAAHAFLFQLYLPHRYTYPLLPFFAVAVAVTLRPTLEALGRRRLTLYATAVSLPVALALIALTLFPLGPRLPARHFVSWLIDARLFLAVGLVIGLLVIGALRARAGGKTAAHAAAAVIAGALLAAEVTFAGGGESYHTAVCSDSALYDHLGTLPKDAIVAGDPLDVNCIPIAARRPVVISEKLYQPWDREYFMIIRERMFRTVEASYGPSRSAIVELRSRYGADYFLVRDPPRARPWPGMAPFSEQFRRLKRGSAPPAALRLPTSCRTWQRGPLRLYDLACVASASAP